MTILLGIIGLLLLAIRMGKYTPSVKSGNYLTLAILALLQVCVTFFVMFTMKPPTP